MELLNEELDNIGNKFAYGNSDKAFFDLLDFIKKTLKALHEHDSL